jgi:Cu+-exporting ATPase
MPRAITPGQPARVTVTLTSAGTGAPVTDLTLSHQVWMHLIATRADLGTFAHVHPEPTGQPGQLAVTLVFPTAGRYVINTEFRRDGEMADIHDRQVISIPAPRRPPRRWPPARAARPSTASASGCAATPGSARPAT